MNDLTSALRLLSRKGNQQLSRKGNQQLSRKGNQQLLPSDRVKKRAHFQRTQERGRKHHTLNFLVVVLPRGDEGPARVGITVTKKVGNAVQRNRIKRIVREVFRRERARFPVGCDVVWIAKNGCVDMTYDKVLAQVPSRWTMPR